MNIKETDYSIMARLEIDQSAELEINNKEHIIRDYAQCTGVNKFVKIYELNIHPTTELLVKNPEGFLINYEIYLYLVNKNKKIVEVPESKIEIAVWVFNKLFEKDIDFSYENYKELREKTFSDSMNQPYITQPFIGHYKHSSQAAESWNNYSFSNKDISDMLQKCTAFIGKTWNSGLKEGASSHYTINPRETLASNIYKTTYDVTYNYDDYTDKKS